MQSIGFVRRRYFRMASRSNYVRDRSNFGRQNSNVRGNSRQNFNQGQNRNRSGSAYKPKTFNAKYRLRALNSVGRGSCLYF